MALDEQKYWEKFIAFVVLVFTIYAIARDYLQPVSPLINYKALTSNAVIYAMIASTIIFFVGLLFYRYIVGTVPEHTSTTTNTPQQTPEKPPSRDYLKAQLDLLKMVMAAFFSIMLVILWTTIQNFHTWDTSIMNGAKFAIIFFGTFSIIFLKLYVKCMEGLKDQP